MCADPASAPPGGSLSAEDLLGRVLIAPALPMADEALPSQTSTTSAGTTWVKVGLPAGYWESMLARLAEGRVRPLFTRSR